MVFDCFIYIFIMDLVKNRDDVLKIIYSRILLMIYYEMFMYIVILYLIICMYVYYY